MNVLLQPYPNGMSIVFLNGKSLHYPDIPLHPALGGMVGLINETFANKCYAVRSESIVTAHLEGRVTKLEILLPNGRKIERYVDIGTRVFSQLVIQKHPPIQISTEQVQEKVQQFCTLHPDETVEHALFNRWGIVLVTIKNESLSFWTSPTLESEFQLGDGLAANDRMCLGSAVSTGIYLDYTAQFGAFINMEKATVALGNLTMPSRIGV
ncbi:MAG: hypothetical protein KDK48_04000 [Chlamydiia bacterium]|nr:hypothetical protein [Chlamydiia bacterium]